MSKNQLKSHELKSLQGELSEAMRYHAELKQKVTQINHELVVQKNKVKSINEKIGNFAQKEIVVSEHALLRLCERKFELPIDVMGKELIAKIKAAVDEYGSGKFPIGDGLRAVVNNRIVVTVEPSV